MPRNLETKNASARHKSSPACRNIICEVQNLPLVQDGLELSYIVFISLSTTVLNENLISRDKSVVVFLYVELPKKAEVGSFESE